MSPAQSPASVARVVRLNGRSPLPTWMPLMTRLSAGSSAAWLRIGLLLLFQGALLSMASFQ